MSDILLYTVRHSMMSNILFLNFRIGFANKKYPTILLAGYFC